MPNTLVDTGVWLSLVDPSDTAATRPEVDAVDDLLEDHRIVLPWPVGFETLRTKLARKRLAMLALERRLKSPHVEWVDDQPYRADALEMTFEAAIRGGRALSMVDCLMRLMLDDVNLRIDYFATWNGRDFEDVCQPRGIAILQR